MSENYTPPKVWVHEVDDNNRFASINRPVSGATHERELPVGEHPLQLYSLGTPNGQKVTIMLEELLAQGVTAAEYDAHLINILEGDQFSSGFVAVNPNSKIPALMDNSESEPVRVFESAAILVYLAEKFGHFLSQERAQRTETLNWLFWVQGAAPILGGGFGHFYAYANEKQPYPINRFTMEVKRQLDVLDKHLATHDYLAGDQYSIADMAAWPWYGKLVQGQLYNAGEFLQVESYTHVLRWANQINQRVGVQRGQIVNRTFGEPWEQLAERHSATDIDQVLALRK
ncbi:glutathione-dependent disulfide-bond oxidoreductase [Maribrevibacterium harenarium]|uniref:Glutathione-dependent disulfide-bond oxidoreductase n=1 Tax=Maribrevibacterium harenarium TaxID=2589817 RepID=A0A501X401_9GAMM|nr:glutathione-dependent disulfide-bond oxidoreductase [Maribrevibacterium harenarium]TPE55270.1 glutathione-dependent disulfide-bond oxidoreductase [Maribrevibacterium harenarium]